MVPAANKHYILDYTYVDNMLEKRKPHHEAHLEHVHAEAKSGKLLLAGPAGNPVDSGLLIFQNIAKEDIEAFIKADPYVKADLVSSWKIRPFSAAAGTAVSALQ